MNVERGALMTLAVCVVLALTVTVFLIVAIWTGDTRWAETAGVLLVVSLIAGFAAAALKDAARG